MQISWCWYTNIKTHDACLKIVLTCGVCVCVCVLSTSYRTRWKHVQHLYGVFAPWICPQVVVYDYHAMFLSTVFILCIPRCVVLYCILQLLWWIFDTETHETTTAALHRRQSTTLKNSRIDSYKHLALWTNLLFVHLRLSSCAASITFTRLVQL